MRSAALRCAALTRQLDRVASQYSAGCSNAACLQAPVRGLASSVSSSAGAYSSGWSSCIHFVLLLGSSRYKLGRSGCRPLVRTLLRPSFWSGCRCVSAPETMTQQLEHEMPATPFITLVCSSCSRPPHPMCDMRLAAVLRRAFVCPKLLTQCLLLCAGRAVAGGLEACLVAAPECLQSACALAVSFLSSGVCGAAGQRA